MKKRKRRKIKRIKGLWTANFGFICPNLHSRYESDGRKCLIKFVHFLVSPVLPQVVNNVPQISLDDAQVKVMQQIGYSLYVWVAVLPKEILGEEVKEMSPTYAVIYPKEGNTVVGLRE